MTDAWEATGTRRQGAAGPLISMKPSSFKHAQRVLEVVGLQHAAQILDTAFCCPRKISNAAHLGLRARAVFDLIAPLRVLEKMTPMLSPSPRTGIRAASDVPCAHCNDSRMSRDYSTSRPRRRADCISWDTWSHRAHLSGDCNVNCSGEKDGRHPLLGGLLFALLARLDLCCRRGPEHPRPASPHRDQIAAGFLLDGQRWREDERFRRYEPTVTAMKIGTSGARRTLGHDAIAASPAPDSPGQQRKVAAETGPAGQDQPRASRLTHPATRRVAATRSGSRETIPTGVSALRFNTGSQLRGKAIAAWARRCSPSSSLGSETGGILFSPTQPGEAPRRSARA